MSFNDHQLFYAALYMTEALPGASAFLDDICKKHGMNYVPMNAPVMSHADVQFKLSEPQEMRDCVQETIDLGVTADQCHLFFDSFLQSLREGKAVLRHTYADKKSVFYDLECTNYFSSNYRDICPPLETALAAADIPRPAYPRAHAYVHDNGELIVRNATPDQWTCVDYPGKPAMMQQRIDLKPQDFTHLSCVLIENIYRIVPLQEGQSYVHSYDLGDGKIQTIPFVARKNSFYTVDRNEVPDFKTLTDEEILANVHPGYGAQMSFEELLLNIRQKDGSIYQTTKDPRFLCWHSEPVPIMEVTDKIVMHRGRHLVTADPGDKVLYRKTTGRISVVKKEDLDTGKVCLVPAAKAKVIEFKPKQK